MSTCRSMVLEGFGMPLKPWDIEIPALESGQILVKLIASGVCGSDLHMAAGKDPRTRLPITLGHEGVGIVADIKGRRTTLDGRLIAAGDRIIWNRGVSCGHCYYCSVLREPSLCPERWVYGIHTCTTEAPYLNGCFSEYIILSADTDVFSLQGYESIPINVLVSASCSGATAAHGFDIVPPDFGSTVLVFGPGPLGLFGIAFAKKLGASKVIVVGGSPERLRACKRLGADVILNRRTLSAGERRDMLMDVTHGRGADYVFDAAGDPKAIREGIDLMRSGGTLVSAGFGVPAGTMDLDCYSDLVRKNARFQGVWVSDVKHTQMALDLLASVGSDAECLVSHVYPLASVNEALDMAKSGGAVKVVISESE